MMLIQWAPLEQGNTVRYRSNTSCNRIRCKRRWRPTWRRLQLRNQRRMIRRISSLQRHRAKIFSFKSQLKALTPREMLEHHKDEQKRTHQHCWRERANPSPSGKLKKAWEQRRHKWQTQTAKILLLEHPQLPRQLRKGSMLQTWSKQPKIRIRIQTRKFKNHN